MKPEDEDRLVKLAADKLGELAVDKAARRSWPTMLRDKDKKRRRIARTPSALS
jgi:hypothetical protein